MQRARGTHFDPGVLDAFFSRRDEILRIRELLPDTDSGAFRESRHDSALDGFLTPAQ